MQLISIQLNIERRPQQQASYHRLRDFSLKRNRKKSFKMVSNLFHFLSYFSKRTVKPTKLQSIGTLQHSRSKATLEFPIDGMKQNNSQKLLK